MPDYKLIDSGDGQKLERFGPYTLIRPCAVALWKPADPKAWESADAAFQRLPDSKWKVYQPLPLTWEMSLKGLKFKIERTSFGHLGLFPEHSELWDWLENHVDASCNILNLFGYTGATSLFAASCGAKVCHLDASKGMVERAKENAVLNKMQDHPLRWIVDDVFKFLKREVKRERTYEGIILDPPSFGRGAKGEVFKIERDLVALLESLKPLLSKEARFVLLTCHTPGISPIGLKNLMKQVFVKGDCQVGELILKSPATDLPKGIYAKWTFR